MTTTKRQWGWSWVLAALAVAACTGQPAPTGPPPPAPSVRVPSSVVVSSDAATDVRAAVATYTSMLEAFVAASNTGSGDTTELARYATGSALRVLSRGLADNQAKGLHTRGTPSAEPPQVTSVAPVSAPTSVSVRSCVDDSRWMLYHRDGQAANNTPGGRRLATAEIRKTDGVWKVDSFAIRGAGTCT